MRKLIYILTSLLVATLSIYPVSAHMGMHMDVMENTETEKYHESMEQIMCGDQACESGLHMNCEEYASTGMMNMMYMYMSIFNPIMSQSVTGMLHMMM